MFNNNGYSLSDIAAVTGTKNGDGMWGGDGSWWIILLFLFAFNGGWGNGGGYGAGRNGQSEISYSFDMNGLENGVRGIQQGLCDGFYAMNTGMMNGFAGVQSALCQGFSGVNNAITTTGYDVLEAVHADTIAGMQNTTAINQGLTALGTQIAQCCCDNKYALANGFAELNYNLASQGCDTRRAIADGTREIIEFLTQDKIAALTAENQALKFAASQSAQNAYIAANQEAQTAQIIRRLETPCPIPAYVVPNPNCCYTPATFGGCGGC